MAEPTTFLDVSTVARYAFKTTDTLRQASGIIALNVMLGYMPVLGINEPALRIMTVREGGEGVRVAWFLGHGGALNTDCRNKPSF